MNKIDWFYGDTREARSKWLCERFFDTITKGRSVLDVGCSQSAIRKYLPDAVKYTGIDISGNPDIILNLDRIAHVPFNDNSFDCVICADVLEHLENIHFVFDELCRIANRFVIITLPNPIYSLHRYILKRRYANPLKSDKFGNYLKYYGLPREKPDDRHRWFYGYDEAVEFLNYRASKNGLTVDLVENNLMYEPLSIFRRVIFGFAKILNPDLIYRNIIFLLSKIDKE